MEMKIMQMITSEVDISTKNIKEILKSEPWTFTIEQYAIEDIGNLSVMNGSAAMGTKTREVITITPIYKDAPILEYNRFMWLGKDNITINLFDLTASRGDYSDFDEILEEFEDYTDIDRAPEWYDSILRKESVAKNGKKATLVMSDLFVSYLEKYLQLVKKGKDCDNSQLIASFTEKLVSEGGELTTAFVEHNSKEKIEELYKKIIFGIL